MRRLIEFVKFPLAATEIYIGIDLALVYTVFHDLFRGPSPKYNLLINVKYVGPVGPEGPIIPWYP
jgi:hypothetical protein